MLDEIRTFIAVADSGSLQGAAARVFRTPSAATRQIQRLELALGAVLLDRAVKPPRLTAAGRAALEQCRALLGAYERLQGFATPDSEPRGTFRLGLAHALSEQGLATPILRATRRFPGVQPQLSSDCSAALISALRQGDLDAALVILPQGGPIPRELDGALLATEAFALVRAREKRATATGRKRRAELNRPWIVNPSGCLVRDALRATLERAGHPLRVAAELHDLHLQLSLVAAGIGLGVVPTRLLSMAAHRSRLEQIHLPAWSFAVSIALVRVPNAGPMERLADAVELRLREYFTRQGHSAPNGKASLAAG